MSVKYDVGGSLMTEFWTSSGFTIDQGSKFAKTSFGDTTRPMNSVGKKKTKCQTTSAARAVLCLRSARFKRREFIVRLACGAGTQEGRCASAVEDGQSCPSPPENVPEAGIREDSRFDGQDCPS